MRVDQGFRDRGGRKGVGLDEDFLFRVPEFTDDGFRRTAAGGEEDFGNCAVKGPAGRVEDGEEQRMLS